MSDPSNLEQLKAWIRGPHDFEQTAESLAPFLFKASWAEADIRGAMDYAIQRVRDIEFDLKKILKVAVQYPDRTGVTNVPEYIDLLKATLGANTIHFDFIEPGSMHLMLVELIDPKATSVVRSLEPYSGVQSLRCASCTTRLKGSVWT